MKAKNLRIGNYIRKIDEGIVRVEEIDCYDDKKRTINYIGEENYNELKLTKDLALSFGGELIEDGFDSDEGGLVCVIDFGVFTLKWSNEARKWRVYRRMTKEYQSLEDLFIAKIQFVHDWQNLHFALTGEELELND